MCLFIFKFMSVCFIRHVGCFAGCVCMLHERCARWRSSGCVDPGVGRPVVRIPTRGVAVGNVCWPRNGPQGSERLKSTVGWLKSCRTPRVLNEVRAHGLPRTLWTHVLWVRGRATLAVGILGTNKGVSPLGPFWKIRICYLWSSYRSF